MQFKNIIVLFEIIFMILGVLFIVCPLEGIKILLVIGIIILFVLKSMFRKKVSREYQGLREKLKLFVNDEQNTTGYRPKMREFRELYRTIDEMTEQIRENRNKKIENYQLFQMLLDQIKCHLYQIDLETMRITHRGNMIEQQEYEIPYQGIETIIAVEKAHPEDIASFQYKHDALLEGHIASFDVDVRIRMANRVEYSWVNIKEEVVEDAKGNRIKIVGFAIDITGRKQIELDFKTLSEIDGLTGLFNKTYFEKYVTTRLGREREKPSYLIMIDLDDFKQINDKYGHQSADRLLVKLSVGIDQLLHQGNHYSIAARFGGDEFLVWFEGNEGIELILEDLLAYVNNDIRLEGEWIAMRMSIGVAKVTGYELYETAFKRADQAMYQTKKLGKNTYTILNKTCKE
ncbi:MAG: GGDEF domain-containing protein [Cellulosilyticaceae bacterium]